MVDRGRGKGGPSGKLVPDYVNDAAAYVDRAPDLVLQAAKTLRERRRDIREVVGFLRGGEFQSGGHAGGCCVTTLTRELASASGAIGLYPSECPAWVRLPDLVDGCRGRGAQPGASLAEVFNEAKTRRDCSRAD